MPATQPTSQIHKLAISARQHIRQSLWKISKLIYKAVDVGCLEIPLGLKFIVRFVYKMHFRNYILVLIQTSDVGKKTLTLKDTENEKEFSKMATHYSVKRSTSLHLLIELHER